MADEKLVSNIYFRGTKVSSTELTITDTSVPPVYNISYFSNGVSAANAQNVIMNKQFTIQLKQNPLRTDVKQLYYRWGGAEPSKFTLTADTVLTAAGTGGLTLDSTGTGVFKIDIRHYPNLAAMNATLDVYHDSDRTSLLASIPVRSLAVTGASLRVVSGRSFDTPTVEQPPLGIFNNDTLFIEYRDNNINAGTVMGSLPIAVKMGGVTMVQGNYPQGGNSWIYGNWVNSVYTAANGAFVSNARQRNPSVRGNVVIEVKMGDLTVTNNLIDDVVGTLKGEVIDFTSLRGLTAVTDPLPLDVYDRYSRNLSIGYAFTQNRPVAAANPTAGNPPKPLLGTSVDYLTNLVVDFTSGVKINPYGVEYRSGNDGKKRTANSRGMVTYLAWNKETLLTQKDRRQFGKFQNCFSMITRYTLVNGNLSYENIWNNFGTGLTLENINNSLSTALYGALTNLLPANLAAFVFTTRDNSLSAAEFSSSGSLTSANTSQLTFIPTSPTVPTGTLPAANPSNPNDRCFRSDILFLRNNGRNEKNIFDETVPFPRIVNVQTNRGYPQDGQNAGIPSCYWDFELDPSLGIDLTDGKYTFITTVQADATTNYEFWVEQTVSLVARSPNKVTFRSGANTINSSLSLAILETQKDSIPTSVGTGPVRAVRPVSTASTLKRFTAGNDAVDLPGAYINTPRCLINGWVADLNSITGSVLYANLNGGWDGNVYLTFKNSSNANDNVSTKPSIIYLWLEGIATPIELLRNLPNMPDLVPSVTAATQPYSANVQADMLRICNWLEGTNTTPKGLRFTLSK